MIARPPNQVLALALLFLAISDPLAYADGLDPAYFIRFDVIEHSWTYICTVLTIIMVANYLLNFAVIGLPAILRASVSAKRIALGLIVLTIMGQVADRVGSIVGLFLAMPLSALVSVFAPTAGRGLDSASFGYSIVASNLICSGIAVGGLAAFFSAQAVVGCEGTQLEDRDCSGGADQPGMDTPHKTSAVMTLYRLRPNHAVKRTADRCTLHF